MGSRRPRAWWIGAALWAGVSACGPAPIAHEPDEETGFAYAAYHASCSPVDGPAEVLALTQEPVQEPYGWPVPRLTVDLYAPPFLDGPAVHEGEGPTSEVGVAARCGADDDCQVANRFRLRVDSVSPEGRVMGFLAVEFPGDEVVAGPFTALPIEFEPVCP